MRIMRRSALAAAAVLLACALSSGFAGDAKDEMVDNPYYKGWASAKPGAKVLLHEKTVHADGSVEERSVEYKLLAVNAKRVTVQAAVIEKDLLSLVESAPTRIVYPAKVSRADMRAARLDSDPKKGMETIKVMGKEMECSTLEYAHKDKTEEVKIKTWRSATVPGGIVHRVRSTAHDGKLVATTTTTLQSFGTGEKKNKGEKKPKD